MSLQKADTLGIRYSTIDYFVPASTDHIPTVEELGGRWDKAKEEMLQSLQKEVQKCTTTED